MDPLVTPTSRKRPAVVCDAGTASLSKIAPPTLQRVYANKRLFDRLDAARTHRVVWVHGAPGAGKTTLVASYLAARDITPVWYRLDGGDADPATVFFYLSKAAAQKGSAGAGALPLLTAEFRAGLPLFARRFFRDLFAIPETSVVVFDDYHEVAADAALHACLPQGLEEVPEGRQVVIVSRTPPPAPFARLRLNGVVEVIEPDALRMTHEEASGLARKRGNAASATHVESITRQTQGWAAGVILMLEAEAAEIAAATAEKAPVPELLFDYFAGEILQRMDSQAQRLLQILALMPAPTAAAGALLTGSADAGALLEDLRKRNYFTTRDTAAQPRYRFHPLFREFLLETARARLPAAELTALRIKAAQILDDEEQSEPAVALLAEAGAFDSLAALILRRAPTLRREGRTDTLVAWLARLPEDMIARDGWLSYWAGAARTHLAPAAALPHHRRAFALFEASDDATGLYLAWEGQAESVRLDAFGDFARFDPLIESLPKLMARHPEIPKSAVFLSMSMAVALTRRSHDRAAIAFWQERALREAREAQQPGVVEAISFLFVIADLHDAKYAEARCMLDALPEPRTLEAHPLASVAGVIAHTLALVHCQREGDCIAYVEETLVHVERAGFSLWLPVLAGMASNAAYRRGDTSTQRAWLQRAGAYADRVSPHRGSHYHLTAAHYFLSTGDLATAMSHADNAIALSLGWRIYEAWGRAARAEILIEATAFEEAEAELDRLDRVFAASACDLVRFPAALLRADLRFATGKEREGAQALAAALALGRQQDARRAGARRALAARLCGLALRLDIEPVYVRALIRRSELPPPDPYDDRWPWPIRITTLGSFTVAKDGEPLTFSRKTPKRLIALLKAIAAHGGRNVPEQKLVDAVWPDEDGDAARSAMTIAIHRLRKLLGDSDAIVVSGGTVGLDPSRCWLDLWTVEHLLTPTAESNARAGSERGAVVPRCERVFALYRGDFLSEDADVAWTAPRRNQLRRRFGRMVCARAELPVADERDDDGSIYKRGLQASPAAEELHQGLMRHYLAQGRVADGIATYARLRKALEDIGEVPSSISEGLLSKLQAL